MTTSGRVAGEDQRIRVEQALRGITIEAAYSWRMEQEMGSIAPGKVANFAVLEDDPMTVDPMKLKDIAIWAPSSRARSARSSKKSSDTNKSRHQ